MVIFERKKERRVIVNADGFGWMKSDIAFGKDCSDCDRGSIRISR